MKYIASIITMIFVVCFLSVGNVAIAQEQKSQEDSIFNSAKSSKDWNVMVGYKGWFNKWQTFSLYDNLTEPSETISSVSDTELTNILVLGFSNKNSFISFSYMKTTYSFPNLSDKMDRQEGDMSLGYYINRYFGITAGLKILSLEQKIKFSLYDYDYTYNLDQTFWGSTLGFVGLVPIGKKGFGFYNTFSYGVFLSDWYSDTATPVANSPYYVGELGISYSPRIQKHVKFLNSANVYAGYRFQNMYLKDIFKNEDGKYSTDGFVLGVNLSF